MRLVEQHCHPLPSGSVPLSGSERDALLAQVPGWTTNTAADAISRTFDFADYYETLAFVNALAWIAHREDHHPDLEVSYNRCRVHLRTHSINGLSRNDFICAAKISALYAP